MATAGSIEASARDIVNDTVEAFRCSPPAMLRYVWEGVRKLWQVRPESRYVGLALVSYTLPTIADTATDEEITAARAVAVPIDDRWVDAIVEYVCFKFFQRDEADTANSKLASDHMALFMAWSAQ